MKYYTGIGSRKTPTTVLTIMENLASHLATKEYILRSGHADGADQAFEKGAEPSQQIEIYLPWEGFNHTIGHPGHIDINTLSHDIYHAAEYVAMSYHPAWGRCSQGAKKLHTRNVFQILGSHLDRPTEFVVCWTPNGSGSGGTGQAIRIANAYKIPVFDLGSGTGSIELYTYMQRKNIWE